VFAKACTNPALPATLETRWKLASSPPRQNPAILAELCQKAARVRWATGITDALGAVAP